MMPYSVADMRGIPSLELDATELLDSTELLESMDGTPYSHSGQSPLMLLELSFGTWMAPYTGCASSVHPVQKNEARAKAKFPQCLRMNEIISFLLLLNVCSELDWMGLAPTLWLGPIFKKDENHPFISLFLEMGRRWATRRLGSARRSV